MVSEVMLQQTQTSRVCQYFERFIGRFPRPKDLAEASLGEAIEHWKGLGYNRRILNLRLSAQELCKSYQGKVPNDPDLLVSLPGIGPNTAASILSFAFNIALPFIETNIRTVYIKHFFLDKTEVSDKEILAIVKATLDRDNARQWYYALMDYGVYIKKSEGNLNKSSKHYHKQSQFKGSLRQIRGEILSLLIEKSKTSLAEIYDSLAHKQIKDCDKIQRALEALENEGFVSEHSGDYRTR